MIQVFKVLHIDNSSFFHKLLGDIAIDECCSFYSAKSKSEAFEILKHYDIDLIISGLSFKDDIETQLIPELRASIYSEIPIAIFTADNTIENRRKYIKYGITDFIPKSHDISNISKIIKRYKKTLALDKRAKKLSYAVIEDNALQRTIIKAMFNQYHIHDVSYFESGESLFESNSKFDVYIIDLILPGMLGIDVILKLRKSCSDNVIIAVSKVDAAETIQNVLLAGADDYIIKPVNEDIFFARLKGTIRMYTLFKELEQKNNDLEKLLEIDGLTGLYNHKYIVNKVFELSNNDTPFSIAMLDIDHFKNVNDNFGHPTGDDVLKWLSSAFHVGFPSECYIGRYGGEEFLAIMPNMDYDTAYNLCNQFRENIEKSSSISLNIPLTLSGGIATYIGEDPKDLIKKADQYLYTAKNNGRNKIL